MATSSIFVCLFVFLFVLGSHVVAAAEGGKPSKLPFVTSRNFQAHIGTPDSINLIVFTMPWISQNKETLSLIEDAASRATKLAHVTFAQMDCEMEEQECAGQNIDSYPTLRVYRPGMDPEEIPLPKNADALVKEMERQASPDWTPMPDYVLNLNVENFDEAVRNHSLMLIEFYAPWCGHCQRLEKELKKSAFELRSDAPPVVIAKVDATQNAALATRFNITAYPTLYVAYRTQFYPFEAEKKKTQAIVEEMRKWSKPPALEVLTTYDMNKLTEGEATSVVAFLSPSDTEGLATFFEATKLLHKQFQFGYTTNAKIIESYKAHMGSVFLFYGSKMRSKYDGGAKYTLISGQTAAEITVWIMNNRYPLVGLRGRSLSPGSSYYGSDARPLVVVYMEADFTPGVDKETMHWKGKVADVAAKYMNMVNERKIYFAVSDRHEFATEFSDFGFDKRDDEDIFAAIFDTEGNRFLMKEEFSAQKFKAFIDRYFAGKVPKFIRSLPSPKKQGPVLEVVGSTFEKTVADSSKDVFLYFYAPWCDHCKKLSSTVETLALRLKSSKDLIFAKIDATANDYPLNEFQVDSYPTIYFITSDNKLEPTKYTNEERDLDSLLAFVKEQATVPLPDLYTKHDTPSSQMKEEL